MSKFCFHYIIWPSLFTTELRTDFINSSTCQQLDNVWFNGLSRLNFRYWLFLVCARLCPRAPRAWKLWHGQAGICQFYFYRATGKAGMAKIAGRRAIPGTGMPIAHHYWELLWTHKGNPRISSRPSGPLFGIWHFSNAILSDLFSHVCIQCEIDSKTRSINSSVFSGLFMPFCHLSGRSSPEQLTFSVISHPFFSFFTRSLDFLLLPCSF